MKSSWSTEGCKMVEYNSSHTVCVCYHLTNFAVLFDSTGAVRKQVYTSCRSQHIMLVVEG